MSVIKEYTNSFLYKIYFFTQNSNTNTLRHVQVKEYKYM